VSLAAVLVGLLIACAWTSSEPTPEGSDDVERAMLEQRVAALSTDVSRDATVVSHLATRVMALEQEVGPLPQDPPTRTPYPGVTGSVLIEEGRCCAGGTQGETITLHVAFSAEGADAEVTQMRVRTGGRFFEASEMTDEPWEPFVGEKTYQVRVALNWVGWYVSVQYRDANGNISAVVVDDIAVEGAPSP
jgi:hypothetical protein